MTQHQPLRFGRGFIDGLPICLGYVSVSFAFGMLATQLGLHAWYPVAVSMTSFTGTGQFVGVKLLMAQATLVEIAFTLLIINLRYLLMSLSLSQKLPLDMGVGKRLLVAFGNTDEIYAVAMQQTQPLTFPYLCGLILSPYLGWITGTLLGAVASGALPEPLRAALGIALYAMFIAIIVPPAKHDRPTAKIVLVAVALSCVLHYVPGLNRLGSGWSIIICGVAASAWGAWRYPIRQREDAP